MSMPVAPDGASAYGENESARRRTQSLFFDSIGPMVTEGSNRAF